MLTSDTLHITLPPMILSFRHKGLALFFQTGSKAGINPIHAKKLKVMLTALNVADSPDQMQAPNWSLHKQSGILEAFWAVRIDGHWRIIFQFEGENVIEVDYLDYH